MSSIVLFLCLTFRALMSMIVLFLCLTLRAPDVYHIFFIDVDKRRL